MLQVLLLHGARPRQTHRQLQLPGDLAENSTARLRLLHQYNTIRSSVRDDRLLLRQDYDETPAARTVHARLQDGQAEAGGGRQEQEDQQDVDRHGGDFRDVLVPD